MSEREDLSRKLLPSGRPSRWAMLAGCLLIIAADAGAQAKFHWGVASAGFQHDGYFPDSNWVRYSAAGTNIVNPVGNSVDFYHRYKSDIALAQAMGVNTFRTSMEWSRIEPKQGVINQTELARYDDLMNTVVAAGMTPMVTLDHWVYPGWVKDLGGWTWPGIVTAWMSHANQVVSRYKGRGVMWITINEPTQYISNEGKFGGLNSTQQTQMATYLVSAHRQAYDMIHTLDPGAMVSSNLAYEPPPLQSGSDAQFFNLVTDKLDFIAVDYYYGLSLSNPSVALLELFPNNFWDVKPLPDGLYAALKSYHTAVPALPLYVVENGFPTNNGSSVHLYSSTYNRSNDLQDHIYWIQRAVNDGMNVIGYNHWSLTDNYEWGTYQPHFGLYTVNVLTDPTLARTATDGVATYKQIIANSGVPSGYVPVIASTLCSTLAGNVCNGPIKPLVGTTSAPTTAAPTATSSSSSSSLIGGIFGSILGFFGLAGAVMLGHRTFRRRSARMSAERASVVQADAVAPNQGIVNPKFGNIQV
jgi:beta-glucosidase